MALRGFIFITVLIGSFKFNAQPILTQAKNEPANGDFYVTRQYDSTVTLSHKTGSNQLWDYSSIVKRMMGPWASIEYHTPLLPVSLPAGPCNLQTGNTNWDYNEFYKSSSSPQQLEVLGYNNGTPRSMAYTNTLIKYQWPISYGTSASDVFEGTWAHTQTQKGITSGVYHVAGTGTGTILLPGGVYFTDILQVQIERTDTIVNWVMNGETEIVVEKTFNYYNNIDKFPVLSVTYVTLRRNGTWFPPTLQLQLLEQYAVGLSEEDQQKTARAFPNPAQDWITLEKNGNVDIIDAQGKVVRAINDYEANTRLSVSSLDPGVYLIRLSSPERRVIQKLVIER